MSFKEWEQVADPAVRLPYKGREYEIPPVSAQLGVWLRLEQTKEGHGTTPLASMSAAQQAELILGDAYQAMLDGAVPEQMLTRAVQVAIADWQGGRAVAEHIWENGLPPEAVAAVTAAIESEASETSTSTASANETPQPACSPTTTSPKGSTGRPRTKASPGAKSSRTRPSSKRTSPNSTGSTSAKH